MGEGEGVFPLSQQIARKVGAGELASHKELERKGTVGLPKQKKEKV